MRPRPTFVFLESNIGLALLEEAVADLANCLSDFEANRSVGSVTVILIIWVVLVQVAIR
jgi:hypothetical protein